MKTLSFINLKGGVGKTISAANVAHILATVHGKRGLRFRWAAENINFWPDTAAALPPFSL